MRFITLALLSSLALILFTSNATAERYTRRATKATAVAGCSSLQGIGSNLYKNSKPHRACTRIDCPIDYFEKFPSLLINQRGLPRPGSATLVDSKGGVIMGCGQLPCRDCGAGYRYVCRGNTNAIAKLVKRRTGSYTVYYKLNGKCVQVPDVGRCVGSVKGLCNQALH